MSLGRIFIADSEYDYLFKILLPNTNSIGNQQLHTNDIHLYANFFSPRKEPNRKKKHSFKTRKKSKYEPQSFTSNTNTGKQELR